MKNTDDKATVKIVTSFADSKTDRTSEGGKITFGSKYCFTFSTLTDANVKICHGRKEIAHNFGLLLKTYRGHSWDEKNGILTVLTEETQITVTGLKELNPQFLDHVFDIDAKEHEEGYTKGFSF